MAIAPDLGSAISVEARRSSAAAGVFVSRTDVERSLRNKAWVNKAGVAALISCFFTTYAHRSAFEN